MMIGQESGHQQHQQYAEKELHMQNNCSKSIGNTQNLIEKTQKQIQTQA